MQQPLRFFIFGMLSLLLASGCAPARMDVGGLRNRPEPRHKLECGPKAYLTVWQDLDGDQIFQDSELVGAIVPFTGTLTAAANYNYHHFSAHPVNGPTGTPFTNSVYFYSGPDGLSFAFFLDQENGGTRDNLVDVQVTVKNNDHNDKVLLSDESDEFQAIDADTTSTFYEGHFNYKLTTDGAVVGPLVGDQFEIHFRLAKKGDLKSSVIYTNVGADVQVRSVPATAADEFVVKVHTIDPCSIKP